MLEAFPRTADAGPTSVGEVAALWLAGNPTQVLVLGNE